MIILPLFSTLPDPSQAYTSPSPHTAQRFPELELSDREKAIHLSEGEAQRWMTFLGDPTSTRPLTGPVENTRSALEISKA